MWYGKKVTAHFTTEFFFPKIEISKEKPLFESTRTMKATRTI